MSIDPTAVWLHISQMLALGTPPVEPAPEQPMPTPGTRNVTPIARRMFVGILDAQEKKGIEKYGTTLQANNGRDALLDAMQEAVDLFQYLVQAKIDRDELRIENEQLRAEVARLKGQP